MWTWTQRQAGKPQCSIPSSRWTWIGRSGLAFRSARSVSAKPGIVAGIVGAPGALTGAAEEVGGVVVGDGIAADAAGMFCL